MASKKRYNKKDKLPIPAPQPTFVTQSLVIRPTQRTTQDVGKWRRAFINADYGRRRDLYNLYDDLLVDPFLSRSIAKRIEAITNSEMVFQLDGKSVEAMDDLIDTPEWEDLLTEIMLSKFWGVTVLEFDFTNGFAFTSIPRKHIRTETQRIVPNESDTGEVGISYANDPFFLQVGKKDDYGIMLKAAPYVIYKRGGFGDYAQFVELFGMPFRLGKYNPYDDNTRKVLEEALEKAGSASWAAVPNDSTIEIQQPRGIGDGAVYNNLRIACNEEILVCIVGQTMTTTDGSSKSQSEVHEDSEQSINKADRRFVQRILNKKLLPLLVARGIAPEGGWFNFPEKEERVPLTDRITIDTKLKDIVAIDADYWYETYGVPKPADGNTVPTPPPTPAAAIPTAEGQQPTSSVIDTGKPNKQSQKKPSLRGTKQSQKTKAEALTWWESVRVKLADFFDQAHKD